MLLVDVFVSPTSYSRNVQYCEHKTYSSARKKTLTGATSKHESPPCKVMLAALVRQENDA